jgi:branched-subunit amino acid ABC-type transport system permease component
MTTPSPRLAAVVLHTEVLREVATPAGADLQLQLPRLLRAAPRTPQDSLGSLVYAPLAQMAPFAVILLILLVRPTGLYSRSLVKR